MTNNNFYRLNSYSDINDYIHQYMDQKNHKTGDKYHVNLTFMLSTYRVLISFDNSDEYQLDLRGINFGDLIGFEKKLVTMTEYGTKLPNITNSIDVLNINTNTITDSIVRVCSSNSLATRRGTRNLIYILLLFFLVFLQLLLTLLLLFSTNFCSL